MGKKRLFDIKFLKFLLVGIINTIFGTGIMFLLYNLASFGYWGSSAVSYILASILSFFLNKNFTFKNSESTVKTALRFTVNIAVCYLVAYSISKPIVTRILTNTSLSKSIVEQFSMFLGMVMFTALNYVGQSFFAFREK
ncbi:GtrA family protein [Clostridium bowmanii]|uniref:GtrA family protein n=1 Tax=Clostridium bowmanii TaxID=132925 RepID=UPI001C0C1207|nr:GtrA family protein [Clostridium bowmanii]MBU3191376.1 GtrA family protein [Clostridium bowmanii]MCA1075779.1 GtrA family protein [Clostridium bowmanii]